jgi:beta-lactamase regulating signal transducer with metallopeptidase domain
MTFTDALGWTLLHFLWEGTLLVVVLAVALAVLRSARPQVRYMVSCAALMGMILSAVATFRIIKTGGGQPYIAGSAGFPMLPTLLAAPSAGSMPIAHIATDYLPLLVWAWLSGVIALGIRSLGGWAMAKRFARRHTWPAEAVWAERFAGLAERLAIGRPVRLAVSGLAQVPSVVGWLRPVLLVPAAVFSGLAPEQVEALLLHELAHVRRYDYLVNLLQTAAETLLFYHPAVWWVSARIRQERENCCDDLAVAFCGSTLTYVQALTELEQMCQPAPRLAMAATGSSLLQRVQRLLRMNQAAPAMAAGWTASLAILVILCGAGFAGKALAQRPNPAASLVTASASGASADSVGTTLQNGPAEESEHAIAQLDSQIALIDAAVNTQVAQLGLLAAQVGGVGGGIAGGNQNTREPAPGEKRSGSWLEEIEAEGYRDLSVDQLIALKIHGVTGEYIRQMRAAGYQLTPDELLAFRIHGVTADFIQELHQAGLQNPKPDDLIALKIHGADPAWIRQVQALGFPGLTVDKMVQFRIFGITPAFIQDARKRFPNVSLDQLIALKQFGILDSAK